MRIAVIGASGRLGAPLSTLLESRGHELRRLHRGSAATPVDLRTGAGLVAALDGVDVVVNVANQPPPRAPEPLLLDGTRRLLAATDAHHVCVSIVGLEALAPTSRYYRAKLAQERLVRDSGRPFSIVRATQLHGFVGSIALGLARVGLAVHSRAPIQPVAGDEVAAVLARVAVAQPTAATLTVSGPETLTISQLRAGPGLWIPLPVGPRSGRILRAGALTAPDPDVRGVLTYAQWLAAARDRPWRPAPGAR